MKRQGPSYSLASYYFKDFDSRFFAKFSFLTKVPSIDIIASRGNEGKSTSIRRLAESFRFAERKQARAEGTWLLSRLPKRSAKVATGTARYSGRH